MIMTKLGNQPDNSKIIFQNREIKDIYFRKNKVWENEIWIVKDGVVNEQLFNSYFNLNNSNGATISRIGANITYRQIYPYSSTDSYVVIRNLQNKNFFIELDNFTNWQINGGATGYHYGLKTGGGTLLFSRTYDGELSNNTPTTFYGNLSTHTFSGETNSGYKQITFRIKNLKVVR